MPTPPSIAVVTVTYNAAPAIADFARSLAQESDVAPHPVIVIDNASTDGTVAAVRALLPQARLIINPINRGFAAGVNQAVALTQNELVLLANPDTGWDRPILQSLATTMNTSPMLAAISPRLVYPDGRAQPSVRRFPTHANIWFSRGSPLRAASRWAGYTLNDPTVPSKVEAIAATFMLVRRMAFDQVSGMDEKYFLYVEDTDLCKRWHDAGWECWIDPRVTVTHDWQGGSRRDPVLSHHHRSGICRYFQLHHSDKPIRNAVLFAALGLANQLDRWRRDGAATS